MSKTDTALVVMFNKPAQEVFRVKLDAGAASDARLTEEQEAVSRFSEGRAACEANPGSGKSFMLQDRSRRVSSALETDVRTLHSFGFQLIRRHWDKMGMRRSPNISKATLFSLMQDATRNYFDTWDGSPWDRDLIEQVEGNCYDKDLEDLMALESCKKDPSEMVMRTLRDVQKYRRHMRDRGLLSFDMMLRLPAENRSLLETLYVADHVMVDEFQDVNQFQFDMVESICHNVDVKSVVVVGDPKQCIYEWRGALSTAFPRFYDQVPDAKRFEMTRNFRSRDEILQHADAFWPSKLHGVRGSDPLSVQEWDTLDLHPFQNVGKGCAVLCRYNRDAVMWQLRLAKEGIGVNLWGRAGFWNMKHIKLAMKQREDGGGWNALQDRVPWGRMMKTAAMQDEDRRKEVENDARWLLKLTEDDMQTLRTTLDDSKGVNVLTMHKSKGAEFPEVLVHRADEHLREERTLYYVAATRAEDYLYLG